MGKKIWKEGRKEGRSWIMEDVEFQAKGFRMYSMITTYNLDISEHMLIVHGFFHGLHS